jgi:hypothetical protein
MERFAVALKGQLEQTMNTFLFQKHSTKNCRKSGLVRTASHTVATVLLYYVEYIWGSRVIITLQAYDSVTHVSWIHFLQFFEEHVFLLVFKFIRKNKSVLINYVSITVSNKGLSGPYELCSFEYHDKLATFLDTFLESVHSTSTVGQ